MLIFMNFAVVNETPSTIHFIANNDNSIFLIVDKKTHSRKNLHCLRFFEYSYLNESFCRVQQSVWNEVSQGDAIFATGSSSFFGLYASVLSVIEKRQ